MTSALFPFGTAAGRGVKVLEGLAYGLPVVSTSLGAEGIDVRDGDNVLLADDAASFAAACNRVLLDRPLAARLGEAGRVLWASRYRTAATIERVAEIASAVADARPAHAAPVEGTPAGDRPAS